MTAIVKTFDGQSLTFLLTKSSLDKVVNPTAIAAVFPPSPFCLANDAFVSGRNRNAPVVSYPNETYPDQAAYARLFATTSTTRRPIPREQVVAIIREALIGGGMAAGTADDTAQRIYAGQFDCAVDKLASSIVSAAVAAG